MGEWGIWGGFRGFRGFRGIDDVPVAGAGSSVRVGGLRGGSGFACGMGRPEAEGRRIDSSADH